MTHPSFEIATVTTRMPRPPLQARSIASTGRMLDAAEAIFAEGGADAVTVAAVVKRSDTSTGSFYARFGDRAGLLQAMHARFLERMGEVATAAVAAAARQATLAESVAEFVARSLPAARHHRESILFFVATSATDTPLRSQGLAANPAFAAAFAAVVLRHRGAIAHPLPELAADVAFRFYFAMFIQRAMFTPREATGRALSDKDLAAEIVRGLIRYLTGSAG